MSSARRTQYRVGGLPAPRIECRIRFRDRGVVKHRDVSAIDRQLSLLAAVSASIRRLGGKPSTALIDELLDERIASPADALRLAPAGRGDRDGDADQRDDRAEDGPSGGVAHRAARHHPESLKREQQTEQRDDHADDAKMMMRPIRRH